MPPKDIEARRAYQNKHYSDRIKIIHNYKEANPCADCGRYYPYYVMQFDHIGKDKFRIVSHMRNYSMERIMAEIAKCELVCANCHAVRTYNRL